MRTMTIPSFSRSSSMFSNSFRIRMSCLSSLSSTEKNQFAGRSHSRPYNGTYLTSNSGRMLKGGRKTNRSLTKQDCYVRRGLYELFDHFVRYFRDLGVFFLMQQPAQYLILVHEIACRMHISLVVIMFFFYVNGNLQNKKLTIVNMWYLSFKKHQSGKGVYAIFLCFIEVADLHESYVVLVTVVVDVLQFAQHLLTLLLIFVICRMVTESS